MRISLGAAYHPQALKDLGFDLKTLVKIDSKFFIDCPSHLIYTKNSAITQKSLVKDKTGLVVMSGSENFTKENVHTSMSYHVENILKVKNNLRIKANIQHAFNKWRLFTKHRTEVASARGAELDFKKELPKKKLPILNLAQLTEIFDVSLDYKKDKFSKTLVRTEERVSKYIHHVHAIYGSTYSSSSFEGNPAGFWKYVESCLKHDPCYKEMNKVVVKLTSIKQQLSKCLELMFKDLSHDSISIEQSKLIDILEDIKLPVTLIMNYSYQEREQFEYWYYRGMDLDHKYTMGVETNNDFGALNTLIETVSNIKRLNQSEDKVPEAKSFKMQ